MCDDWMPLVKLPLTPAEFRLLPRNSAYKYDYREERACLTPRPRHYHAVLDLQPAGTTDSPGIVRRLAPSQLFELTDLFASTFRHIQPFGCLDDDSRRQASRQALERVRSGGDGPWIERASFVAEKDDSVVGAILITLLPLGDPCRWETYRWREPPPEGCIEQRQGQPHLTWIFVAPSRSGHGIGTSLLAASTNELLGMGYDKLLSTFMIGNDSSTLWHWRSGFRLLAYPGSPRLMDGPHQWMPPSA